MSNFKPLLAYTVEDTSSLQYPLFASVKLDGIRVVILEGVVYSRSMKPIRSKAVQELFGKVELNGIDGEVLYGAWNAYNVFNLTTQTVMATELKPEFSKSELRLAIFDHFSEQPYEQRHHEAVSIDMEFGSLQTQVLVQQYIQNEQELLEFEKSAVDDGFEGIMVRSINGRYKQGRSTAKEGIIGKIKRFSDDEAVVIGFEEKMTNTNEKLKNELGYSQRSQAQEGDRKSTRLNSSHIQKSRMPSSA